MTAIGAFQRKTHEIGAYQQSGTARAWARAGATQFTTAATGTLELTISAVGDTPKAIMCWYVQDTADDTSTTSGEHQTFAFMCANEDAQWCTSQSRDKATFHYSGRAIYDTGWTAIKPNGSGGTSTCFTLDATGDGTGSNPGPIAGGWRVSITTNSQETDGYLMFVVFGGEDLQSNVFVGTANGTTEVESTYASGGGDTGFEADLVVCGHVGHTTNTSTFHSPMSTGFATAADSWTLAEWNYHNIGTSKNVAMLANDLAHELQDFGTPSTVRSFALNSIDREGIHWVCSGSSSDDLGFMSLDLGGNHVALQQLTLNVSTDWSESTDLGFEPKFMLVGQMNVGSADTVDGTDAGGRTFTVVETSDGAIRQHTGHWGTEDNTGPENVFAEYRSSIFHRPQDGGTAQNVGTLTTSPFTSTGWTWPSSVFTSATSHPAVVLTFESDVGGASLTTATGSPSGTTDTIVVDDTTVNVTGVNLDGTTETATITAGAITSTQTSVSSSSDTAGSFTFVRGDLPTSTSGRTIEVNYTVDAQTASLPVTVTVESGWDDVLVASPVTDSTSILSLVSGTTPAAGDVIEWEANLETSISITGATQANPVVLTVTQSWNDGDVIYVSGVVGMTELNGNYYQINNATGTTVELQDLTGTNVDGTGYTAYTSGGDADRAQAWIAANGVVTCTSLPQTFDWRYWSNADNELSNTGTVTVTEAGVGGGSKGAVIYQFMKRRR